MLFYVPQLNPASDMHRNSYDSDNTVLSPAGRLHQVRV